ncbi:immunity 26/phosphotriesterase HocA family protein [Alkalibacillus haloalkaliphilus]|uniref:Immunity protein 26 of polymorphic toxin system n=1 Tax=Alkalibacillus haloalkaliphilus TaxID=94136 RepID=A0A511W4F8_9BACI|nr:immunity 26/phosphotriesterase HocA family protein [Alkalibacillus haloalkaliphilus]GEN45965.1 hypothetical protein AHA02nite_17410 [Alkalibacillus haloalkaliphilus]
MDLLIKMKPSRKKRKAGEVFVLQPKEGIYFYGRVMKVNISIQRPGMSGWSLVYIYQNPTNELKLPNHLDNRELLIAPKIVNNQGWLKGYFCSIGHIPVKDEDYKKDYGFWDIVTKQYLDEEGKPISFTPTIYTDFGIGSYGSVAYDIKQVIDKKPSLLNT